MATFPDSELAPEFHRQYIEDEIERLIGLLDFVDADPDLEEGGDNEPSLGSLGHMNQHSWSTPWFNGRAHEDYELDTADDEDGGDNEPSLGSIGSRDIDMPQTCWALGNRTDLEDACDDEGADAEGDAYGNSGATRNYDGPCSPVIGRAQPA